MDRAWLVAVSSMALLFMTLGFVYSFGELYDPIKIEFNTTKSFVASIGGVQQSLTFFIAPLGSLLLEHIGHRRTVIVGLILSLSGLVASSFVRYLELLYVTFGLFGTGAGMIVNACINIVGMHFRTGNSSRAFAVVSAGIPTGTFAINLIESYTNDAYGWRKSLLLIACMYVVIAAISLISFTAPASVSSVRVGGNTHPEPSKQHRDLLKYLRVLCVPKFVLYEMGVVLLAVSISFHYIDFVSVIDAMIEEQGSGTLAVSVLSLSDLLALISLAILGNRLPRVRRHILPLVLLFLNVPSIVLFAFSTSTYAIYIAASLSGVSRGILLAAPFSLALEIFGADRVNECLTHTIMAIGIGSLTGPIALSFIAVRFSCRVEFLTCALTSAVGAFLFMIESCLTLEKPAEQLQRREPSAKPTSYGAIDT